MRRLLLAMVLLGLALIATSSCSVVLGAPDYSFVDKATCSGSSLVDLQTDAANCGACGKHCAQGALCSAAACTCPPAQTLCLQSSQSSEPACVDVSSDPNNCGKCGALCTSGMVCQAGSCGCPMGTADCGCEATSVHESGSNDTPDTANAIPAATGTFCGMLDSATDVDFVTFTLPAGTKSLGFRLAYRGQGLEIEGTAGGETFNVFTKPALKPGQKYVLKVHSSGTTPVSYLLSVDIKL